MECFIIKWRNEQGFIDYMFNSGWFSSHSNWYEGVKKRTPSTNNALESFNNVMKNEDTFRERYPLGRFMELSLTSIKRWSNLYKNKDKIFFEKTEPSLEQWTIAYQ